MTRPEQYAEVLAATIRSVTDLWDEPLDEVRDVPQIVNALMAARPGLNQETDAGRANDCRHDSASGIDDTNDGPEKGWPA